MAVTRRQCREWALQMLCQFEANPPLDMDRELDAFWRQQWDIVQELKQADEAFPVPIWDAPVDAPELVAPAKMRVFSEERVRGVMATRDDIDLRLKRFLDHWEMYRLGSVERNVLRLGAWELLNCRDVPKPVAINEAVDLAKYFSSSESGRFVNGVLDRLRRYLENSAPQPEPAAPSETVSVEAVAENPPSAPRPSVRKGAKKPGTRKAFGAAKKPGARKTFGAAKKPGARKAFSAAKKPGARKAFGAAKKPGTRKTFGVAKKPGARKTFGAAKKPGARKTFGAAKKPLGGKPIRKRASKSDS